MRVRPSCLLGMMNQGNRGMNLQDLAPLLVLRGQVFWSAVWLLQRWLLNTKIASNRYGFTGSAGAQDCVKVTLPEESAHSSGTLFFSIRLSQAHLSAVASDVIPFLLS